MSLPLTIQTVRVCRDYRLMAVADCSIFCNGPIANYLSRVMKGREGKGALYAKFNNSIVECTIQSLICSSIFLKFDCISHVINVKF